MAQRTNTPITVEEFERMIAGGLLTKDDHVEWIEGVLVEMEPVGAAHAGCVDFLNELLVQRVSPEVLVRVQSSIEMRATHMPQPDLGLLRRHSRDYRRQRPRPEAVRGLDEILGPPLGDPDSAKG